LQRIVFVGEVWESFGTIAGASAMPKNAGSNRLTPIQIKNFKGPGVLEDGAGLRMVANGAGSRWWALRIMIGGVRKDYGLGSPASVTLAEARDRAIDLRRALKNGLPLPNWNEPQPPAKDPSLAEEQAAGEATSGPTFEQAFEAYFKFKARRLSNPKHAAQWRSTMRDYVYPSIKDRPVAEVTPREVIKLLEPIWETLPETARRVLQRLRNVFDAAIVQGDRITANPTTGVSDVLGRERTDKRHHAALPFADVPAFIMELRERKATVATQLCFEFLILTAARSGEARLATWSEIDLDKNLWTVPKERMKARREHVVPISAAAQAVLAKARRANPTSALLFPGSSGVPLSDMTLTKLLRDMGYTKDEATAHGMRSAFKDWCAVVAKVPDEVSEAALAHVDKDKVRAAYRRTNYLDARIALMEAWAAHCLVGTTAK
jgi:integrase